MLRGISDLGRFTIAANDGSPGRVGDVCFDDCGGDSEAAMRTVSSAVERLVAEGFTANFGVVGGRLRAHDTGRTFAAHEVVIREYERFEGISDPDDMAIVYALESLDGTRGLLTDAFGVYSSPAVSAFLQHVPFRRAVHAGPVAVHA